MGSYDRQPEDWDRYAGAAWAPQHVIFCNSKWSARPGRHDHQDTATVRACYQAARDEARGIQVWACTWLLEGRYDDGSTYTFECGAPTRESADGYACDHGHDYVTPEARAAQGWDYAADEGEAELLRRYGTQAVAMNGGSI
jgi:hypothetical protein